MRTLNWLDAIADRYYTNSFKSAPREDHNSNIESIEIGGHIIYEQFWRSVTRLTGAGFTYRDDATSVVGRMSYDIRTAGDLFRRI